MNKRSKREEPSATPEPTTLIIEWPQFQHYYLPDSSKIDEIDFSKPFNLRLDYRSCLTPLQPGESKRCSCNQYLLVRPQLNQRNQLGELPLNPLEQQLDETLRKEGE